MTSLDEGSVRVPTGKRRHRSLHKIIKIQKAVSRATKPRLGCSIWRSGTPGRAETTWLIFVDTGVSFDGSCARSRRGRQLPLTLPRSVCDAGGMSLRKRMQGMPGPSGSSRGLHPAGGRGFVWRRRRRARSGTCRWTGPALRRDLRDRWPGLAARQVDRLEAGAAVPSARDGGEQHPVPGPLRARGLPEPRSPLPCRDDPPARRRLTGWRRFRTPAGRRGRSTPQPASSPCTCSPNSRPSARGAVRGRGSACRSPGPPFTGSPSRSTPIRQCSAYRRTIVRAVSRPASPPRATGCRERGACRRRTCWESPGQDACAPQASSLAHPAGGHPARRQASAAFGAPTPSRVGQCGRARPPTRRARAKGRCASARRPCRPCRSIPPSPPRPDASQSAWLTDSHGIGSGAKGVLLMGPGVLLTINRVYGFRVLVKAVDQSMSDSIYPIIGSLSHT